MAKEQRFIRIHGKVQGVGYRFFATRVARRLGLKGSIQNNRYGTVDAVVEGEKNAIDDWISTETCSIWPTGQKRRVWRAVKATIVPALICGDE